MDATLGPDAGRELLDELGFLHVPGAPTAAGAAYLFIALRRRPTLHHFDPERINYWVTPAAHGMPAEIEWGAQSERHDHFSWGPIAIIDRLGMGNEFVSFGGELTVAVVGDIKVAVFASDAPILACGGHSQTWDPWARGVVAFQAELRAAADPRGRFERRLAGTAPTAIYAAFVRHELDLRRVTPRDLAWQTAGELLYRERRRLKTTRLADWQSGLDLLAALRDEVLQRAVG